MYTVLHNDVWGVGELAKFADAKEMMEYVSRIADSYADDEIIIRLDSGKYIMPFTVNSIIVLCHHSQWDARIAEHAFEYHGHENLTSPTKILGKLREERDMWESRANEQLAETEKLENEVLVLKREVECLNETVSEQKGINYELGEMVQRYFIKNDKLEKQIDSLKIENRMNRNLRTRHEIESAIWKFIFEHGICSLEEFEVKFDENDDTYVFILTNGNWRLDEEDFEILRPTLINNYGKNTSVLITAHRASYENAMKAGKYHCGWD